MPAAAHPSSRPKVLWSLMDRYLLGQLAMTIIFALVLFTIIWLAPDVLFKLIQYIFSGKISALDGLTIFLLHIPGVLQQSLPIAVLLGALFVFQRLSQQFEITIFQASGISARRILFPVAIVGALFALVHWGTQEYLTPVTGPKLESYARALDLRDVDDRQFVFVDKNTRNQLKTLLVIGQSDTADMGALLSQFIILSFHPTASGSSWISRIVRANRGRWNAAEKVWDLYDGIDYTLNEEGVYQKIESFQHTSMHIDRHAARLLAFSHQNPMDMNWRDLRRYIQSLKEGGQMQEVPYFQVRLAQKAAGPMAAIALAVIGALLGLEKIRSSRTTSLTAGALAVFAYSLLVPFASNLGSSGVLPPALAAWLPILLVVGGVWTYMTLLRLSDEAA
ncbi:MAG: LptF/LptG family permease [Candidatus Melainabacteria bacterium]